MVRNHLVLEIMADESLHYIKIAPFLSGFLAQTKQIMAV